MNSSPTRTSEEPHIERVMHELVRRELTVMHTEMLTPHMKRITFGGDRLRGFRTAFDDHIKIFFPLPDGQSEARDYTPRAFNADDNTLVVDFVIHEGGIASAWAAQAKRGDLITMGGPRGSRIIRGDIDEWLFIGDEAALPAIARAVSELPESARATALISVNDETDQQTMMSPATLDVRWLTRNGDDPSDAGLLSRALAEFAPKPGCFVWVATEVRVARALRKALVDQHGMPSRWMKVAGYWTYGIANATEQNIEE